MKKPSLSDLAQSKPQETIEKPKTSAIRSKQIAIRVHMDGWKELNTLVAELSHSTGERHSVQSMLVDAINDILKANGRPPVA